VEKFDLVRQDKVKISEGMARKTDGERLRKLEEKMEQLKARK